MSNFLVKNGDKAEWGIPEGYPTKSVQTTVLMEEQEVAFSAIGGGYGARPTNSFRLVLGQTYTVNWDGTEYEFVASLNPGDGGKSDFIGDLSGEPFAYMSGIFFTTDPSPSHTISVKTIQEVVTPMAEEFLPDTAANKEYVDAKFADGIIIPSSTADSTKKFKITVDDSGTLSATEVTA